LSFVFTLGFNTGNKLRAFIAGASIFIVDLFDNVVNGEESSRDLSLSLVIEGEKKM
jgi:hypothetical protein